MKRFVSFPGSQGLQMQLRHSTSFVLQLLRLERCHLLFSFVLNGSGVYDMHVFFSFVQSWPSLRWIRCAWLRTKAGIQSCERFEHKCHVKLTMDSIWLNWHWVEVFYLCNNGWSDLDWLIDQTRDGPLGPGKHTQSHRTTKKSIWW